MDEFKKRLIHLHHCPGITWKTIASILQYDPKLISLYKQKYSFLKTPVQEKIFRYLLEQSVDSLLEHYKSYQIDVITIYDEEYPLCLKETYGPPWVLYAKGKIDLLQVNTKLAVVGTRHPTQYGIDAVQSIFPRLIQKEVLVVSGLATGIDTLAHETTLAHKGKTIAVIAGGFYHIYPRQNKDLALRLMREGLVLSEYPPQTVPLKWHFPMRNRIISGISKGTFIIEAKEKSGSLITANYAVEEGREVFALPGSIFNEQSRGTNQLIGQGAKLVGSADDILEEFML